MKRPPIPEPVKRACIFANMQANKGLLLCAETKVSLGLADLLNRRVHFDHNPPLALRRRNDDGTFFPEASNHDYIDVVSVKGHKWRTHSKRGLQRGDQTAVAHSRKVRRANNLDPPKARRSRKIQSRPFPSKEFRAEAKRKLR